MPSQSSAAAPNLPLSTAETRALALWSFVQAKTPRLTLDAALEVVQGLQLRGDEDPKELAKRLRVALLAHGVNLKHTHALQAASRLGGHASYHTDPRAKQPLLRLTTAFGPGVNVQEGNFRSWDELTQFGREVLDQLVANGYPRLAVLTVRFTGNAFEFIAPTPATDPEDAGRVLEMPWFHIEGLSETWLEGAPAFVEKIRRHLEERGKAVLDGAEVLHLCADQPPSRGNPGEVSIEDAPNSELVLLREDDEDNPLSSYEIARGDEVTCWHQLELSMRHDTTNELPVLDITVPAEGVGAWFVNGERYVWALETLKPHEYVPGRSTHFIGPRQCERLLRRYKLAKRIHTGTFKYHAESKSLAYLSGVPDTYRVDLHHLLGLLKNAGLTWEECVKEFAHEPLEMQSVLPVGFVFQMLEKLKLDEPNKVFALPNISEMEKVEDDRLLLALLPRVQSVRSVRPWGMSDEDKKVLDNALQTFGAGRRLQTMAAGGGIRMEQEMPYVMYTSDVDELRVSVDELGLNMYAAVTPHLLSTKGVLPSGGSAWPWALGNALFLRFKRQGGMQ